MRCAVRLCVLVCACSFDSGGKGSSGVSVSASETGSSSTTGISTQTSPTTLSTTDPTATVTGVDTSEGSQWAWKRRLDFQIEPDAELSQFPVRIRLDPTRIEFDEAQPGGADLRFYAADEIQMLPHEIELWDDGVAAEVWVGVPDINAGADHIWMVYGNPDAADIQNPGAVWHPGTVGVWHLGVDLSDSSPYVNDPVDDGSAIGEGRIGRGRHFDGTAGIDLPLDLIDTSAGAASLWFRAEPPQAYGTSFVLFGSTVAAADGFGPDPEVYVALRTLFNPEPTEYVTFRIGAESLGGTSANLTQPGSFFDGQWHHVAAGWDIDDHTWLRVDGLPILTGTVPTPAFSTSAVVRLGRPGGPLRMLTGDLDEVRLYDQFMSADRMLAQYASQNDTFVVFGPPDPA